MQTRSNAARLLPFLDDTVDALSDDELLAHTRALVGSSNQLLAALLVHLAEVEARGIHRTRACASLYTYCIYELRFSEDEAFRRVSAARLVKRFPALHDAIAAGELHLTGLLLLGPHLTQTNLFEVLARAKHRTKREITALVRVLDPLPAVPARIEPLGPAPARIGSSSVTWAAFGNALCPVRELTPGERPRDWMDISADEPVRAAASSGPAASATIDATGTPPRAGDDESLTTAGPVTTRDARENCRAEPSLTPQRYGVQFTATDEYVRLVEEARALLSHAMPAVTLSEIQLRALRAFVAELRKQKYATATDPAASAAVSNSRDETDGAQHEADSAWETGSREHDGEMGRPSAGQQLPRRRGRHVPAAVRRAVFARDEGRCSYVAADGRRCGERRYLEFHHVMPFAAGGEHTAANVTLRCRAHNALAAEDDFGRRFVEDKRRTTAHEPFFRQG